MGGSWRPNERVISSRIERVLDEEEDVFHYMVPFDYSGIQWGWIHIGLSLQPYRDNINNLYIRTAYLTVLCVLFGLLASFIYARQITRPILKLREAVLGVADGDLSIRAPIQSNDEVGVLAHSFNQMTDSLLQRDHKLQSVRHIAQQLLMSSCWKDCLDDVLSNLGNALDVTDIIILQENHDSVSSDPYSLIHKWQKNKDHCLEMDSYNDFKSIGQPLDESGVDYIVVNTKPQDSGSSQTMIPVLVARLTVFNKDWGMMVFVPSRPNLVWSDAEIDCILTSADSLGSAIGRKEAEEALVIAKNEAEAASQAKSQFLANMSHEIRTPITGVMGMLDLLKLTPLENNQLKFVQSARSAADTLLTVIGDVLDFSKIEAGKLKLEKSDFSIDEIIDDVVQLFAEKSQEKGIELICKVDDKIPDVLAGDKNRIRQILFNLIGNAIKFTDRGEIVLKCVLQNEPGNPYPILYCSVKDTGCGIAEQDVPRIFQSFTQADSSMKRIHGGTGLGLPISRQLCEMMNGELGVSSKFNSGSLFWFTIQLEKSLQRQSSVPNNPLHLEGMRILLIDDNQTQLDFLSDYFQEWGAAVETSQTIPTGMDMLHQSVNEQEPYHVLMADAGMPDLGAEEMVKRIRGKQEYDRLYKVLMTNIKYDHAYLEKSGLVHNYITKPLQKRALEFLFRNISTSLQFQTLKSGTEDRVGIKNDIHVDRANILIVEDQKIVLSVLKEMLSLNGFICSHAYNGEDAVHAAKRQRFDLILMDCQMPVMDGYEATRQIRKLTGETNTNRCSSDVPIVALTAHASNEDRQKCLNAGMNDYLSKPVSQEILIAKIDKWIERK